MALSSKVDQLKRYLRGCISEVTTLYTMAKKVWKYFRKYKYLRMYFRTSGSTILVALLTQLPSKVRRYEGTSGGTFEGTRTVLPEVTWCVASRLYSSYYSCLLALASYVYWLIQLDSQLRKYFQSTSEVLSYEGNVNAEYMKYHHIQHNLRRSMYFRTMQTSLTTTVRVLPYEGIYYVSTSVLSEVLPYFERIQLFTFVRQRHEDIQLGRLPSQQLTFEGTFAIQ